MREENLARITQLRHELHEYPELSCREERTKQRLMRFLRDHTKLRIVDKGAWFYAVYEAGEDKRNIAFRADFDALLMRETIDLPYASRISGISHKCGHDGHAACLAGAALEIDETGADKNVYFLFQHAEETGQGAAMCIELLKEHRIDEIYAFHNMSGLPYQSVGVIDGTCHWASKGMIVHMRGATSHASEPEKGINPAYAIAELVLELSALTAASQTDGVVVCTVVGMDVGTRSFGVSAGSGDLFLTIRAERESGLEKFQRQIEIKAAMLAESENMHVGFSYEDAFPDTVNDPLCCEKIRHVCRIKGIKLFEMDQAFRCSEDFGRYLKLTKGAMCYVGNGMEYPAIHTEAYDFPDGILETAVELFTGLAEG